MCEKTPGVHLSRTAHVSTRHGRCYDDDIRAEALRVASGCRVSVTASGAISPRMARVRGLWGRKDVRDGVYGHTRGHAENKHLARYTPDARPVYSADVNHARTRVTHAHVTARQPHTRGPGALTHTRATRRPRERVQMHTDPEPCVTRAGHGPLPPRAHATFTSRSGADPELAPVDTSVRHACYTYAADTRVEMIQ